MLTKVYETTVKLTLRYCYSIFIISILTIPFCYGQSSDEVRPFTVVIDAGHGGRDPGCLGKRSKEKDLALKISLTTGRYISENYPGTKVIYTRKDDTFIPLYERAAIANKRKADLFISIHCNYAPNKPHVVGTETFVMGLHRAQKNLDVVKRENSVIQLEENQKIYDDLDYNSAIGQIILQNRQNDNLQTSIDFADLVQDQFTHTLKRNNRGVKQAGFLVLYQTTMPSVLIEAGFLSNENEEKYLMSPKGIKEISKAIAVAFGQYRLKIQGKAPLAEKVFIPSEIKADPKSEASLSADSEQSEKMLYRIQLAAVKNKFDNYSVDAHWKQVKDLEVEYKDGLYKYFTGKFRTLDVASREKNKLREMGFKGAFVVRI